LAGRDVGCGMWGATHRHRTPRTVTRRHEGASGALRSPKARSPESGAPNPGAPNPGRFRPGRRGQAGPVTQEPFRMRLTAGSVEGSYGTPPSPNGATRRTRALAGASTGGTTVPGRRHLVRSNAVRCSRPAMRWRGDLLARQRQRRVRQGTRHGDHVPPPSADPRQEDRRSTGATLAAMNPAQATASR